MTDTTAIRCTSNPVGVYDVRSHTQTNKNYTVNLPPDGKNTCTCIAFAMKRNKLGGTSAIGSPECTCKHIQGLQAQRAGCGWTSLIKNEPAKFNICPRCFSDTEPFDTRNPAEINLEDLMEDFKRLRARMG